MKWFGTSRIENNLGTTEEESTPAKKSTMNRRSFLKTTSLAAVGAALGGGLEGCSERDLESYYQRTRNFIPAESKRTSAMFHESLVVLQESGDGASSVRIMSDLSNTLPGSGSLGSHNIMYTGNEAWLYQKAFTSMFTEGLERFSPKFPSTPFATALYSSQDNQKIREEHSIDSPESSHSLSDMSGAKNTLSQIQKKLSSGRPLLLDTALSAEKVITDPIDLASEFDLGSSPERETFRTHMVEARFSETKEGTGIPNSQQELQELEKNRVMKKTTFTFRLEDDDLLALGDPKLGFARSHPFTKKIVEHLAYNRGDMRREMYAMVHNKADQEKLTLRSIFTSTVFVTGLTEISDRTYEIEYYYNTQE